MSAFIVTNESLNNIVESFFWLRENEFREKLKDGFGINLDQIDDNILYEEFRKFGQLLADLNNDSYNQRYDSDGEAFEFKYFDKKGGSIYQLLKSVECLTYQSCEGDCDQRPLYKFLIDFEDYLRGRIISDLEEYKGAKWE